MANHKSALKRARQSEIRRLRNKGYKTRNKHAIKRVRTAVSENSVDTAREHLKEAVSLIQRSASKHVIHKNKASRLISRLTARVNQLEAS